MAKEKLIRPDSEKTKAMIARAEFLDMRLGAIAGAEESLHTAVRGAASALFEDRVQKALTAMEVEHLNKARQGIRVSLLRDAGIETVWQASRLSFRELCDIDGIGDQTAEKIRETIRQIEENTRQTLRVRIQMGEPGVDETLVKTLYKLIHLTPLVKEGAKLHKAHHAGVVREIPLAKESQNGFAWVFKSRSRKEAVLSAIDSLSGRLEGPFGDGILLGKWETLEGVTGSVAWADYEKNAPAYYAELEKLGLDWAKTDAVPGGLPAELAAEIEAEELDLAGLKATLRSYQTFGVKYIAHQKKSLLGDEMGLGKTMQAIAAMVALKARGETHFMVVCPASVLVNWCREIAKFSDLAVTKIHGNDEEALLHWRENGDVAVTTYESISRFTLPEKFPIGMIVTDEAHYVKNPDTQRTKALLRLLARAEYTLFMSGTPLENRVEEMCFLVSCLQPEVARELEAVKFLSTAEQFRLQLAPVYLRRTREDVLTELPELSEKEQWCDLNTEEKRLYKEAVLSGNFMAIRQVSWQVEDLRCSGKAARLLELCDQAMEQKRKIIIFSFFRSTLTKVCELLKDRCMEPITGAVSPARRQEIVDEFTRAGDGACLVSQVQAGGTGLNIQSASVIIFCEPQIKPSIENQAISRAYRMGQVRDVLVYRLLAEDTIDERIMEILRDKQNLFDNFADESVLGDESLKPKEQNWITSMVEEEKKRLLAEESPTPPEAKE